MSDLKSIIVKGLNDQNPNVKLGAIVLAGIQEDKTWANHLIPLLGDKVWQVREKAALALSRCGTPAAVPKLMKLLSASKATVRKVVLDLLGGVVNKEEDKLGKEPDEPKQVRMAAAYALAAIDPSIVVDPLTDAFNSANSNIKIAAIAGLGNVRARQAIDQLLEATHDKDFGVRASAATAIGKIRADKAVDRLIELISDEKWKVRLEAVIALNHLKPEKAFSALVSCLKDARPEVVRVAVIAVGNAQRPESGEILLEMMSRKHDPIVSRALVSTLAGLNVKEALDPISLLIGHPDENVRVDASKAVNRLAKII